jgi:formylglycine-generating enzyme required for sulfatase activity
MFLNEALAAEEIEMIDGDPHGMGGECNGKRYIDLYLGFSEESALQECFIIYDNGSFKVEEAIRRHWPVVAVSWYGAKAFALHYGFDLPTEAEWEYSAGGGTLEYRYATDDGTIDQSNANYYVRDSTDNIEHPVEVGSYSPNSFGLYDMTGNVEEWCCDWHTDYSPNPPLNPKGPSTGEYKVVRGGYYGTVAERLTTWYRGFGYPPEGTFSSSGRLNQTFGFRVVRRP